MDWIGCEVLQCAHMNTHDIARYIDHTLLAPTAGAEEVRRLCAEALEYGFASVCVNPYWIPLVAELLHRSSTAACGVVGFPLGASLSESKAAEAQLMVSLGAGELDMVANLGLVKDRNPSVFARDIRLVRAAAPTATLKVILETGALSHAEIEWACRIACDEGAQFVKTSTGFHKSGGATLEAVSLLRRIAPPGVGVKASGGIRDREDAERMIEAGASRIGTSSGLAIMGD